MFGGAICADLTKISKNLVTWYHVSRIVKPIGYEGHCFMMMLGLIELVDVCCSSCSFWLVVVCSLFFSVYVS